jgi:hypothetical protein
LLKNLLKGSLPVVAARQAIDFTRRRFRAATAGSDLRDFFSNLSKACAAVNSPITAQTLQAAEKSISQGMAPRHASRK